MQTTRKTRQHLCVNTFYVSSASILQKFATCCCTQSRQLEESGQLAYLGGPACDVL